MQLYCNDFRFRHTEKEFVLMIKNIESRKRAYDTWLDRVLTFLDGKSTEKAGKFVRESITKNTTPFNICAVSILSRQIW